MVITPPTEEIKLSTELPTLPTTTAALAAEESPAPSVLTKKPRKTPAKKKTLGSNVPLSDASEVPSASMSLPPSPFPFSSIEPEAFLVTPTAELLDLGGSGPLPPTLNMSSVTEKNVSIPPSPPSPFAEECVKKRGRKPQGGKLIKKAKVQEAQEEVRASVILHLKCFLKDLDTEIMEDHCSIQPYTEDPMTTCYKSLHEVEAPFTGKNLHTKIKELEHNLHTNNMNDKKAGCFHCTCTFENTPYYIPKGNMNGTYQVYGCFCMPECAAAFLFKETLDTTVKFDRYYMLNHIYGKANGYTQNIKLAPSPFYFLDKFYGNLSISEYRSLFRKEKYYFMVDKPLTRVMPEIYEDNDTHIIHNKFVNAHNKFKSKVQSKSAILQETFHASH